MVSKGGGKKCSDPGHILKVDLTEFADGWKVQDRVKDDSKGLWVKY